MHEEAPLAVPEALRSIGEVVRRDDALKARTEGLTWILWGMAQAGAVLTYAALSPTVEVVPSLWAAPWAALWVIGGVLASVGMWRSSALRFHTGMTWRRGLAFFIAFPLLIGLLSAGLLPLVGFEGIAMGKLLAIGVALVGFGWLNPLDFTRTGRATATGLGVVAALAAFVGFGLRLDPFQGLLFVGAVLGVSWTFGGLVALFRG